MVWDKRNYGVGNFYGGLIGQTITAGIGLMADEIFLYQVKYCNVLLLLIFCIELDKQCKQFEWYSKELLVKILVDILFDVNFIPPPPSSYNRCIIIYFIVLFFLSIINRIPMVYPLQYDESHNNFDVIFM